MCLSGIENASDIALYSGLGAAVVAVAVLVIGVTLYRRSQSDYGVDVIDSSALTGGFQTFNFKTVRQGQRRRSPQQLVPRTIETTLTQDPQCSPALCEGSSWHWEPLPNCLHALGSQAPWGSLPQSLAPRKTNGGSQFTVNNIVSEALPSLICSKLSKLFCLRLSNFLS